MTQENKLMPVNDAIAKAAGVPETTTELQGNHAKVTMNLSAHVNMRGTIGSIANWFNLVRPAPVGSDFRVQLGVHLEEVREMFDEICLEGEAQERWDELNAKLKAMSEDLKQAKVQVRNINPVGLADSLGDQVVTAVGVGTFAGIEMVGTLMAIDTSNYSKLGHDNVPKFDACGKVVKDMTTFHKPWLDPYITDVKEIRWKV